MEKPRERRDEILDAAIALLAEKGYRGTSMLEVARRTSASKETLYSWFGDKPGLFDAAIQRNAVAVQDVMARHLDADSNLEDGLTEFGRAMLAMLLSESAIAINRAAISEAKSEPRFAAILAASGREATLPMFARFLTSQQSAGHICGGDPQCQAGDFIGLLIGDLQVRRLLGLIPEPTPSEIEARVARAVSQFRKTAAPSQQE